MRGRTKKGGPKGGWLRSEGRLTGATKGGAKEGGAKEGGVVYRVSPYILKGRMILYGLFIHCPGDQLRANRQSSVHAN